MRRQLLILFLFFNLQSFSQWMGDYKTLAIDIHKNLSESNYAKADELYSNFKRHVYADISTGIAFNAFILYYDICANAALDTHNLSRQYFNMLQSEYKDNKAKILFQIKDIFNACTGYRNYYNGKVADDWLEFLKEYDPDLPLEKYYDLKMQVAWAYNYSMEPYKAYMLFSECAEGYRRIGGKEGEYAQALNGMAYVSRFLGKKSISVHQKVGDIYKRVYGNNSKFYAVNRDNLGSAYLKESNMPDSALFYTKQAYQLLSQMKDSTEDMVIVLNNLATCYGKVGDREQEIKYLEKAARLDNGSYGNFYLHHNLLSLYLEEESVETAGIYIQKLSDEQKDSQLADLIASYYAKMGDYTQFCNYIGRYISYISTVKRNNLKRMLSNERSEYLIGGHDYSVDSLFKISERLNNQESAALCYDFLLGSKSLSLSIDQNLDKIIHNSSDEELKSLYSELCLLRAYKQTSRSSYMQYESLESCLLDKLSKQNDITSFLDLSNQDVLAEIKEGDLAIEFYAADEHDSNRLYACILQPDGKISLVNLGDKNDKKNIEQIWVRLSSYLTGVKNIYFSPDGPLQMLPIETYPSPKGNIISDDYKVFRLSSTRELPLTKHYTIKGKDAAIYGGVTYDSGTSLKVDDRKVTYLIGSKVEAEKIAHVINIAKRADLHADLFLDSLGTETSFKKLSGQRKRILHVATHGFYWTEREAQFMGHLDFLQSDLLKSGVDQVLSRSGLLFAGAENSLRGKKQPNWNDDGILTANEIAQLDLQGLDLAVLSACQTGLGIVNSEGVFGLPRGFKKAGAKSILMSLWNVDDEATTLLMSEFYKNWICVGKSKYDAFDIAKRTVRSHKEKGWDDPKYWASFILLDALD